MSSELARPMTNWAGLVLSPRGRIGRRLFWPGLCIWVVALAAAWLIPLVGPIVAYLVNWIWFCVCAKRLHDLNRSAWGLVWPFIIGMTGFVASALLLFGGLVAGFGAFNYPALGAASGSLIGVAALAVIADVIWLVWLVRLGMATGDIEVNAYGSPPGSLSVPRSAIRSAAS